jgi:hypothetical protein
MVKIRLIVAACLFLLPALASAQGTAGISGTARDATGGVLPGVTVEASSPALIEKVRIVVTDGAGRYSIVALPPGVYAVTFSLPGFSAVKREGIELTTGFTAAVNAELRVGAVEETITVSGSAPVVDVQNVRRQEVMTRDVIDALPTGKTLVEMATLIPGVQMIDGGRGATGMGGSAGMDQFATLTAHGSRTGDTNVEVNGLNVNVFAIRQDSTYMNFQDGNVQEYAFEVSGHSAESESGGVRMNIVPKEGGNRYSGFFFTNFANGDFQSSNMTDDLRATGLRDPDTTRSLWTVNPAAGGPLVEDRLWYYGGYSRMVNERYKAGFYVNTTPAAWRPTFDLNQQVWAGELTHDANIRLTWQAAPRHKISGYYNYNQLCQCPYLIGATYVGLNTREASHHSPRATNLMQLNWTAPYTGRVLLEAAISSARFSADRSHYPEVVAPRIVEASNGLGFRAPQIGPNFDDRNTNNALRGSVSYVTGSHAAKSGVNFQFGEAVQDYFAQGNLFYNTLNYRPTAVTYYKTPYTSASDMKQLALFGQDQWTLGRLTLNLGLRYDYYTQGYPNIHQAVTEFVPVAFDFPGATIVNWHDLNPRLGVAYDLFGTGKTAVKWSLSRYILRQTLLSNPARANQSDRRVWTDPSGDFVVQGNPLNPAINGELGQTTNVNFGRPVITEVYDPDFATGLGSRPSNWETSASVQHEIMPRVSATIAYHRRWFGNFQVTDNLSIGAEDYSVYSVTAPFDSRLPGGGGYPIAGLYDLNQNKLGQGSSLITTSSKYGTREEYWSGVDLSLTARLRGSVLLQGGASTGKTINDQCDIVGKIDNPSTRFCRNETPYLTQYKLGGSYVLPLDIQVSATFQSFRGSAIQANATFTNPQIAPSLGRNLTGAVTTSIALLEPNTMFNDRHTQVDLRFAKNFRVAQYRMKAMLDVYNLGNANTIMNVNNSYGTTGAAWLNPTQITLARLLKVGFQLDF